MPTSSSYSRNTVTLTTDEVYEACREYALKRTSGSDHGVVEFGKPRAMMNGTPYCFDDRPLLAGVYFEISSQEGGS